MTIQGLDVLRVQPLVSIVMCFHNSIDFVDSALAQLDSLTYKSIQLVLVDDASTDGTTERVRQLTGRLQSTVLCNERQLGVAASRTRALREIEGDYVWFADPDDSWESSILDVMVNYAVRESADVVAAGAVHRHVDGQQRDDIEYHKVVQMLTADDAMREVLALQVQGYLWNKLFRANLVTECEFPSLRSLSDLPFVADVISRSGRILLVPDRCYTYVQRTDSITFGHGGPDLSDLHQAASLVRNSARGHANISEHDLLYFTYIFELIPAVTVAALRGGDNRDARGKFRLRDAALVWPVNRRVAMKILWVRLTGSMFWRTFSWVRSASMSRTKGFSLR